MVEVWLAGILQEKEPFTFMNDNFNRLYIKDLSFKKLLMKSNLKVACTYYYQVASDKHLIKQ